MCAVLSKEGEVVGDGGGGDGRAMLVATAVLGVASEGLKKDLREWGDRQIRGNENEGDEAKWRRVGDINPFATIE